MEQKKKPRKDIEDALSNICINVLISTEFYFLNVYLPQSIRRNKV